MPGKRTVSLDGPDWQVYPLLPNGWRWRKVWLSDPPEAVSRRLPATVPGHAQSALLAAGALPHPYQALNSRLWEWTSQRDWVYTRTFEIPADWSGQQIRIRFEGLDGVTHAFVNEREVGSHAASFTPADFEITGAVTPGRENRLCVVTERAPGAQGQIGWTSRERHWRARVAYGWDFAARLPPVGIWNSVTLHATGPARLSDVSLYTNVSTDQAEAAISIVSELQATQRTPATVVAELFFGGLPVAETRDAVTAAENEAMIVQSLRIPRVQLWWPNNAGRQPLYDARISLLDGEETLLDQRAIRFGVRTLEFVPNEGAPPDSLPYTLVVNGRKLFINGWNWVPADLLYGAIEPARLERLLRLARDAGVNMLRVWGGGLLETERFYNLCDRFGILVWQEFPQSSSGLDNTPPEDPEYLDMIQEMAPAMIARRRDHPSLAAWCGGNELTGPDLMPLGSDHPALALLQQLVATYDPQRAWFPTSPTGPCFSPDPKRKGEMHDVHGPWLALGPREQSPFWDAIDPLLQSEFGCEGAANLETLRWLAGDGGEAKLWPPDRANPLWMHHGGDWWLRPEFVETLFGPLPDLVAFVRASQFLQAEGLKYAVESARRRQWRCSGTLPWQFNEPWPNAICTNAVDYFGRPKPAYWAVRRAYAPLHVAAAHRTTDWNGEAEFRADVWLLNAGEPRALLNVTATIITLDGRVLHQENLASEAPADAPESAGDVVWRFPPAFAEVFVLHLEVIDEEGERVAENSYVHSRAPAPLFGSLLAAPATRLAVTRGDRLTLRNEGSAPALMVAIDAPEDPAWHAGDSGFILPPYAERAVSLEAKGPVRVQAWNSEPVVV